MAALVEKSAALEDKRRQLLDAAVRVFARKGYHASRVGDIAEEAGVAHGLLYHYFKSKDEVLEAVFHENWSLLVARIESVEETDEPAADQLRHISAIVLRTWLHLPDVVRVVIQEFGRSPELAERIGELAQPIDALERVIARGIEQRRVPQGHRSDLRGDGRLRRRSTSCSRLGCSAGCPPAKRTSRRPSRRSSRSSCSACRTRSDELGEARGADVPARERRRRPSARERRASR